MSTLIKSEPLAIAEAYNPIEVVVEGVSSDITLNVAVYADKPYNANLSRAAIGGETTFNLQRVVSPSFAQGSDTPFAVDGNNKPIGSLDTRLFTKYQYKPSDWDSWVNDSPLIALNAVRQLWDKGVAQGGEILFNLNGFQVDVVIRDDATGDSIIEGEIIELEPNIEYAIAVDDAEFTANGVEPTDGVLEMILDWSAGAMLSPGVIQRIPLITYPSKTIGSGTFTMGAFNGTPMGWGANNGLRAYINPRKVVGMPQGWDDFGASSGGYSKIELGSITSSWGIEMSVSLPADLTDGQFLFDLSTKDNIIGSIYIGDGGKLVLWGEESSTAYAVLMTSEELSTIDKLHIVYVLVSEDKLLVIYINGEINTVIDISGDAITNWDLDEISIGSEFGGAYFKGNIHYIRVFNHLIAPSDELYNYGEPWNYILPYARTARVKAWNSLTPIGGCICELLPWNTDAEGNVVSSVYDGIHNTVYTATGANVSYASPVDGSLPDVELTAPYITTFRGLNFAGVDVGTATATQVLNKEFEATGKIVKYMGYPLAVAILNPDTELITVTVGDNTYSDNNVHQVVHVAYDDVEEILIDSDNPISVPIQLTCVPDQPFYVRWINTVAGFDYGMFARRNVRTFETKDRVNVQYSLDNKNNTQGVVSVGAECSITVGAGRLTKDEALRLDGMTRSPLTQWYNEDVGEWETIIIPDNTTLTIDTRSGLYDFEIEFTLPRILTQF